MSVRLSKSQKELIEKFGVFMEKTGITPAQSRILGLLLICDKAELTFDEIYQTLGISKSAASNALNALLVMEKIEYHTKPGDRKRYFVHRIGHTEIDFDKKLNKLLEINILLKEVLIQRPKTTPDFNKNLKHLIKYLDFLQNELPALQAKWEKMNS